MPNNKLILRSVNSPWVSPFNDITTGSVLSWADVDNNFIYLKGEIIHSGYTSGNSLILEKINGSTINLDLEQFGDEGNRWYVPANKVVEVPSDYQSFIYGDLYLEGLVKLNDNSQLVVLNGDVIMNGGSISGNGTTLLVDLPMFDTKLVNGYFDSGILSLVDNAGNIITVSGISATDIFITGGTYNMSNGIATFTNNIGGTFNVSGFLTGYTNFYTTGATLIGSTAYFDRTDALSAYTLDLSGIDFTGNTSASCINDLYISNLYGCSPITLHDSLQAIGSTASGLFSYAFGNSVIATGVASHAEGNNTTAGGNSSHAEGGATKATGVASHAEGNNTTAGGNYSHAEGNGTTAFGDYSHAEGSTTTAGGNFSHAEGSTTTSGGDYSHAEGISSQATGSASHAEGYQTIASGVQGSHSEGYITKALGETSHAEGVLTTASAYASHTEGHSTTASGTYSHAEGYQTVSSGNASHAEGQQTIASGFYSHAEGRLTIATGNASHAEGSGTTASSTASHAEGGNTTASGERSHAEGANTVASAYGSHAEGGFATAIGNYSHAEGSFTNSNGNSSHAEGQSTSASADYSHAEGLQTKSTGIASHSEGYLTTASGQYSHTEGDSTTASGQASHAGGVSSTASGLNSFIHSSGSTVSGIRSVVLGGKGLTGPANDTVYVPNFNSRGTSLFSGSSTGVVTIIGSGTTAPIFSVQGSSGELFSVTDSLVGSLFSVNDISGLPVLEVFSNNTILMGDYQAQSLNTTVKKTLSSGMNNIYAIPTSGYTGAFFDYTLLGSAGARAGNIMSIWSGSSTQFLDTKTTDIGSTTGVTFSVVISGSSAVLMASGTTSGWTLKTIVKSI